jgi:hypothetical protein
MKESKAISTQRMKESEAIPTQRMKESKASNPKNEGIRGNPNTNPKHIHKVSKSKKTYPMTKTNLQSLGHNSHILAK